jgi:hypothetical protein
VDVGPIDARQLSTALRQLFPDQQTQSILPLGSGNQLLLQGFGPSVLAMARQLQDAAAREGQRLSEVVPPKPEPASVPPK